MNKYITMLLLGVVVIAMALVFGVHMRQAQDEPERQPASVASETIQIPASPTDGQDSDESRGSADGNAAGDTGAFASPDSADSSAVSGADGASQNGAGTSQTSKPDAADGEPLERGTAQSVSAGNGTAAGQSSEPALTGQSAGASAKPSTASKPAQSGSQTSPATGRQASPATGTGDKTATATRGQGSMKQISLKFRGNGMYLSFEADSALPVKYFLLHAPERLVVDLPGAWKNLRPPQIPSNQLVKSIRLGRQDDSDRLVLDLSRKLTKHELVRLSDQKVEIVFE